MASIDSNFKKVTDALRKHGQASAKALINTGPFVNELLAADPKDAPKGTDFDAVSKYFDRTGTAKTYISTIENPDKSNGVNVTIAAKLQSDFLAGVERDYRIQHSMTRIRSICMTASRRQAQGSDEGVVVKGIAQLPQSYLKLGQTGAAK